MVMPANGRRAEFKSNLQGFFLLNTVVIMGTHLLAGNYTSEVWRSSLVALPWLPESPPACSCPNA